MNVMRLRFMDLSPVLLMTMTCVPSRPLAPLEAHHAEVVQVTVDSGIGDDAAISPPVNRTAQNSGDTSRVCPSSIAFDPPLDANADEPRALSLSDVNDAPVPLYPRDRIDAIPLLFAHSARTSNGGWTLRGSTRIELRQAALVVVIANWAGEGSAAIVLREMSSGYCIINTWQFMFGGNGVETVVAAVHSTSDRDQAIIVFESKASFSHGGGYSPNQELLTALIATPDRVYLALQKETQAGTPNATWQMPVQVIDRSDGAELVIGPRHSGDRVRRFKLASLPVGKIP